ncbi:CPBP family intramembrane glutamic endopeptidase [Algibacter mikhailovii]|uniref:CPBP family intramembrane glutamic endopeptidase n=1 Tax=Algibacter mikhailovii TaxID=425498 RepID=UPI0024942C8E|nr:CPBP family intramembrane metalloprotease [Algibacter mikhailovii]
MKTILHKYPFVSKFVLAIILFGSALFISGILNKGVVKRHFPYVSCLLLLMATWFLYRLDKQSLKAIGLNFSLKNMSFLPIGVLVGAVTFLAARILRALYFGESIEISTSINYSAILLSFYFILPQVTTEEFLFRGYLFQKTISITSIFLANVIFSMLFMLIHVFDENVLNNIGMMILLAVTIPVGHLLFATALIKSKTLFFPIGIHLGNNWATRHIITDSDSGESILFIPDQINFDSWTPFIVMILLTNGFFLCITFLIWKWDKISEFIKRKNP